uniref:non-specific serine/threonine protein kinase n=1 Tax=Salix viminalis TaxID=40686 RepID=A0A6N2K3T8_SALVM
MAVPFFLSVPLLLLLCQHGSGSLCSPENTYTDEGLPCAEVDALEKIIVSLGLPKPLVSHTYCSPSDDKSISFECGACNESTTNSCRRITSLVTHRLPLHGQIDESLSNLTHLTKIDLSRNQLHGTIPESLGKLTRLKTLRLGFNRLSGQIPPTLGNLEALETLDLQSNFLNDSIPPSLGKLMNLTILFLSYNMLSGRIPKELGNLLNLNILSLSENRLSGYLPQELGNLSKLGQLSLHSNSLTGTLPDSFVNLKSLHRLNVTGLRSSVSGNKLSGEIPPFIANFTKLTHLVLRNCSLTGGIPDYIGNNWKSLYYLDLSFNDLSGSIHKSLTNASLERLSLTNNKLNGSIPPWILKTDKADLSYNNFADFIKDNITDPAHHDSTEVKTLDPGKPNMDSILALNHSLFINCGGARVNAEGNPYDEDISTESFFSVPGTWAYSCSGDFIATNRNSSEFVKNMTSGVSVLYKTARFCPVSLKYYGFCLRKAIYTVELHFAETIYTRDEYYSSLGTRIFDVYIQKIEGSQHIEMAKGPNVEWKANSPAIVDDDNPLEIHFSRRGKGSLRSLNGPLVSAISVTPNFDVHDGNGKLSASQIAGITIANSSNDSIPSSLGNLKNLTTLSLRNNRLSGYLPQELGKLSKLEQLYLGSNNLTGGLPDSFDNLKSLLVLNVTGLRSTVSGNKLSGEIPPFIANFTNLTYLVLRNCSLTGGIPDYIGNNWKALNYLDLSFNNLNGSIPQSLKNAPFLNRLLLTNNELNGSIPLRIVHQNGERKLTDLNIIEKAKGPNKAWKTSFPAIVDDNPLEIHFFWAGKGSLFNPAALNGPLVSAISVTPIHDGKLSASQIAGITIGCAFAPLLLFLFVWQMRLLGNRELRVQLLGGYSKKDLHLLIYEYMETGSLHKALFEQRHTSTETELSWSARFDICLGIAKGLNYLHEEEEKSIKIKIVHGNINAKNILLDKTHTAKLSDFGLATIYNEEDPFQSIKARETRVYMAPEHALGKAITVKADVYSYGVVVLEIVSGRSNTEYIPNQEADFLLDTAGRLHQQGRFLNLVDKKLGSRFDNKQALTLLHLAMECINQSPTLRPSMSEGERKLKDLNIIEMAKGPNEAWKTNFTAIVDDNNPLEIHFFWAGKGSLFNPPALNGPLVSAISVTPNFNVHDGKLSASQIAGITIGCAFAPLLLFLFVWKMRLLGNRELREKQIEVQNRSFTLQQIIDGTKNFSSKMEIGRGRFGVVYKANLPDQIKLAVKKISPPSEQREKDELKSEIGNLTSLSHENLVQLFGGYSSKDLHLLIYEYMETGSLQKALFEQRHTNTETELHWSARFDICLGIAKGLNYLHEEEEKSIKIKIVHGNINAKNILLDKNQTAKLSDFGLATIYNEEDPFTAIKARGSRVYMAPEHALGKAITVGHI